MNFPQECVMWPGRQDKDGYGVMSSRRSYRAHRLMYELFVGPIPDGWVVMHSCDTPQCCNPRHLSIGTPKENSQDAARKGRMARGERVYTVKLTPEAVREIRAGLHRHEAKARFGIGTSAYYMARKGRTWRHVS